MKKKNQANNVFHVLRLGVTGRFALLILVIVILPMFLTSWLVESGNLPPGKNLYLAIPVTILILLFPAARLLGYLVINRELRIVNRFCMEIKKGNYAVHFDLDHENEEEDEFLILLRNLTWMSHNLHARREKNTYRLQNIQTRYVAMKEQAQIDELTGLYNRRHFETVLLREAKNVAANNKLISLIFMDCDKFKVVNDTMGHHVGDTALQRLADSIRHGIRLNCDIPFRFGGDEFAVLLPDTAIEQAMEIANRIQLLYSKNRIGETTLSIGVTSSHFNGNLVKEQVKTFVRNADQQAYYAKQNGGNNICAVRNCCIEAVLKSA